MAKKRRPKPPTNNTAMTTDPNADAVEASDTTAAEPTVDTIQPEPEPQLPVVNEAPALQKLTAAPKDVLRAAFNKRTIDSITDEEWDSALAAVASGKMVTLNGAAPHLRITQDIFDPEAPLPTGVTSPVSILNNIVAGMI